MESLLNNIVVVDVTSMFVYIGELTGISDKTLTLQNVDVHDLRDSKTTRERYVLDARRFGVHANRRRVLIQLNQVVSASALEDVLEQ